MNKPDDVIQGQNGNTHTKKVLTTATHARTPPNLSVHTPAGRAGNLTHLSYTHSLCVRVTLQKVCVQGSVTGSMKTSRQTGHRQSSLDSVVSWPRPPTSEPSTSDAGDIVLLLLYVTAQQGRT